MALEDCEILAMLLAHHQDSERDGWRQAAKLYSDMRIPRLLWIRQEADKRSGMKQDMSILQEMVMYFFIWLGCVYFPVQVLHVCSD
jgi:2-polyprenyl-6-methoxyphenol hydroxylase-like FAD-dependent oxidoreductase